MRPLLWILLFGCLLAPSAHAQVTNGFFDDGLNGWSTTTSGTGTVVADSYGNPANAARISAQTSGFVPASGGGSIAQSFGCGGSFDTGVCVISLDYRFTTDFAASARITVLVDGSELYVMDHAATMNGFTTLTFAVACGLKSLVVDVTTLDAPWPAAWAVWVDNVTAVCEPPVSTDAGEHWGTLKSTYQD